MQEKIVIAGGTGFVGQLLAKHFAEKGFDIVILSHSRRGGSKKGAHTPKIGRVVPWHPHEGVGDWRAEIEGARAVINMSGYNLGNKRWSNRVRAEIINSRVDATRALVAAIAMCDAPPPLISTSASGFYGSTLEPTTEASGAGGTFLAMVCRRWEEEAVRGEEFTRVAIMRLGVVLDQKEGMVARLLPFYKAFIGGPLGSGRQWLPWVHKEDVINAYERAVLDDRIEGVYNIVAPGIVQMSGFAQAMGSVTNRPSWLRVPTYLVRLLRGRQADMILHGQHIVPMRTAVDGFQFKHHVLTPALQDILNA